MTGTAKATTLIDNERVIVTEYRFRPGDNTGWHRHGHDYVIVPMMDGRLKIDELITKRWQLARLTRPTPPSRTAKSTAASLTSTKRSDAT